MKQDTNQRAGDRERPARDAAAAPTSVAAAAMPMAIGSGRALAPPCRSMAGDDHGADENRHGRIDPKQMATVHAERESSAAIERRHTPAGGMPDTPTGTMRSRVLQVSIWP